MDVRNLRPLWDRPDTEVEAHRKEHDRLRDILKIWLLVALVVCILKILLGGG